MTSLHSSLKFGKFAAPFCCKSLVFGGMVAVETLDAAAGAKAAGLTNTAVTRINVRAVAVSLMGDEFSMIIVVDRAGSVYSWVWRLFLSCS